MPTPLEFLHDGSTADKNFRQLAQVVNPPIPQARVYSTAAHAAVGNGTTGTIAFDTEDFDSGDLHSNVTNNSRLTAPITGVYVVAAGIITGVAGGRAFANITRNGSQVARSTAIVSGGAEMNVTTIVRLADGDYVELTLTNASGGSLTPTAGNTSTWLSMVRLGGYVNQGV